MTDMPVTDIPAGAQRSDDGQWWWDGSQWQPVPAPTAAAGTQPAQDAVAEAVPVSHASPTPTAIDGQLSDDGQWRWAGTRWQPASADPAASTGATAVAQGEPQVTLGLPAVEQRTAHDGTTAVMVDYSVTNSGTTRIEANSWQVGFFVTPNGQAAEAMAYVMGDLLVGLAPGDEHHGNWPLQVDPGSWTVSVTVTDPTTGDARARSDDVTVDVAGHEADRHAFDDTQAYALTLTITNVERVEGPLYRVHYDVQSDRDVPAGLSVVGRIVGRAVTVGRALRSFGANSGRPPSRALLNDGSHHLRSLKRMEFHGGDLPGPGWTE
jgi:hypothetical protein